MEFSGRLTAFPLGDLLQWAKNDRCTGALGDPPRRAREADLSARRRGRGLPLERSRGVLRPASRAPRPFERRSALPGAEPLHHPRHPSGGRPARAGDAAGRGHPADPARADRGRDLRPLPLAARHLLFPGGAAAGRGDPAGSDQRHGPGDGGDPLDRRGRPLPPHPGARRRRAPARRALAGRGGPDAGAAAAGQPGGRSADAGELTRRSAAPTSASWRRPTGSASARCWTSRRWERRRTRHPRD